MPRDVPEGDRHEPTARSRRSPRETARQKVQAAEDAWNTRDPERVALAYTEDSVWRNRDTFVTGRAEIVAFLTAKWERELDYALRKDLWAFDDNRIAVRFQYESHDADGQWWRSYGNELWEFDDDGLMRRREASINDLRDRGVASAGSSARGRRVRARPVVPAGIAATRGATMSWSRLRTFLTVADCELGAGGRAAPVRHRVRRAGGGGVAAARGGRRAHRAQRARYPADRGWPGVRGLRPAGARAARGGRGRPPATASARTTGCCGSAR